MSWAALWCWIVAASSHSLASAIVAGRGTAACSVSSTTDGSSGNARSGIGTCV